MALLTLASTAKNHSTTISVDGRELELSAWIGEDGAIVVQVDTHEDTGHVRIALNDGVLFNADPEAEQVG